MIGRDKAALSETDPANDLDLPKWARAFLALEAFEEPVEYYPDRGVDLQDEGVQEFLEN